MIDTQKMVKNTILFSLLVQIITGIVSLHAIEITPERPPNDRYWHSRDMNLYYGWSKMTDINFWETVTKANLYHDTFSPGYY
jgi:hypothetical protein